MAPRKDKTEVAINAMRVRLDRAVPHPLSKMVPDNLFELPAVVSAVAKRGSGKTTVVSSLLRDYQAAGLMQRVFLISPNADSIVNKALFEGLVEEDDCYKPPTWASYQAVLDKVKREGEEWRAYLKAKADYAELQKFDDPTGIPEEVLELAYINGWFDGPPTYKYGDIKWPSLAVVIDDAQSTQLFATSYHNPLTNSCVKNRHEGGIGLTIIICCQSYSAQNGLLRPIREQTTVFLLWRQASEERRKQIAKELGADLDMNTFLDVYDEATNTEDSHDFLTVDFNAPKERRFRQCFHRVITPDLKTLPAGAI